MSDAHSEEPIEIEMSVWLTARDSITTDTSGFLLSIMYKVQKLLEETERIDGTFLMETSQTRSVEKGTKMVQKIKIHLLSPKQAHQT